MMKRSMLPLFPLALGLQLLSGCKGCEPPPIPVEPKEPTKAVKQTSPDTEISKVKLGDPKGIEQACIKLHDQMKGRVALIRQRQGDTTSKFPKREAVIKTCKELPPAAVRCMIADVARARGMECRAFFKSLKPEQLQKVGTWRNFLWTGSLTPPKKMPPPKKAMPKRAPPPKK